MVLTTFVSVVALLTGVYTLYKNFIERAKVKIVPGDRMAVICGPGGARRIHLRGALLNDATKMGTLQHLEAKITNLTSPNETVQTYSWSEFVELVPGTMNVQSGGPPLPIPIPGKDSRPLQAQLELIEPNTPANWTAGRHRVEVFGWVNREKRRDSPNATAIFHLNIASELASDLRAGQPEYKYQDIPIEEWSA